MGRLSNILAVRIKADAAELERTLRRTDRALKRVGKSVGRLGSTLTRRLSVPLAAAGVAATKFATDFDTDLTKIETLVGVAADQVNRWRDSILSLAPAVGRGPGELSKALFVVTSAGQRGANALGIVEQAAKASAIGLGDTTEIARAVTAAMQAYGSEALSAERATEILVATVREGNLEASDLSGSLGRVIGIASQVGVTFDEVGAFVATFTRLGVKADEAVVALRGTLNTLLKPTKGAREALASVGLSIDGLRQSIREKGLTRTLIDLVSAFKGNTEGLAQVIPNVRALAGVLGTAGAQADDFDEILGNVTNSAGILQEAFERVQDSPGFKFKALVSKLQVLAVKIGDKLLPIVTKFADKLGAWAEAYANLSEGTQQAILKLAGLALVLGPLLIVVSQLIIAIGTLGSGAVLGAIAALFTPGGALLVGLGLFAALIADSARGVDTLTDATKKSLDKLTELQTKLSTLSRGALFQRADSTAASLRGVRAEIQTKKDELDALGKKPVPQGFQGVGGASRAASIARLGTEIKNLEAEERKLLEVQKDIVDNQKRLADLANAPEAKKQPVTPTGGTSSTEKLAKSTDRAALSFLSLQERMRAAALALPEYNRGLDEIDATQRRTITTHVRLGDSFKEFQSTLDRFSTAKANAELARQIAAFDRVQQAARQMAESIGDAFESLITGSKSLVAAIKDMVSSILRELLRLAIQRSITAPLVGLFGSILGGVAPNVSASAGISRRGTLAPAAASLQRGSIQGPSFSRSLRSAPAGAGGSGNVTMIQPIVEINAADTRSFAESAEEIKGLITGWVSEAVSGSQSFARSMRR